MEIETKSTVKLDVSPNSQAWIYYVNNKPTQVRFDLFPNKSIELWLEHPSDKRNELEMLKGLVGFIEAKLKEDSKLEDYAEEIEDLFHTESYPAGPDEVDYRRSRKAVLKDVTEILKEVKNG
jgi:hypothetical protein